MRKFVLVALLFGAFGSVMLAAQPQEYYLTGNVREATGIVLTGRGEQRVPFFGAIGIKVTLTGKRLTLLLTDLNLVSKGVPAKRDGTGLMSLMGDGGDTKLFWNPKTGQALSELSLILHYELIDKLKGFRKAGSKGEMDVFVPFTERMRGKFVIKFLGGLQVREKGKTSAECELDLELSSAVLGVVKRIRLLMRVEFNWTRLFAPAQYLRIQPVFIGTGPSDPNATGKAFHELMKRAVDLWDRCGSVRCIKFIVNPPLYLNKPAYRVLETEAEAATLRSEVNVADAVEVFVVERMDFACSWGGGACFSSGTAAAKVVTCDQQLEVPAPCPCPAYCPATCPPCPPCQTGDVNYYHLAHELGHALNLAHPPGPTGGLAASTVGSNMEPSGFCCDNPDAQSAKNCRNAANPLLYWSLSICRGWPDIRD